MHYKQWSMLECTKAVVTVRARSVVDQCFVSGGSYDGSKWTKCLTTILFKYAACSDGLKPISNIVQTSTKSYILLNVVHARYNNSKGLLNNGLATAFFNVH